MRWWLVCMCLLLPGCIAPEAAEQLTGFATSVAMDARSDGFTDGRCFSESHDGRCHWIHVTVDNTANDNDLEVGTLHWDGVGSDGGVYDGATLEGPRKVAAGAEGSLRLGFDVTPGTRVDTLRYGAFDEVLLRIDVE